MMQARGRDREDREPEQQRESPPLAIRQRPEDRRQQGNRQGVGAGDQPNVRDRLAQIVGDGRQHGRNDVRIDADNEDGKAENRHGLGEGARRA